MTTETNKIALGIDTGGTYTDAVLYDYTTSQIISNAKSLTTHENLTIGIASVLNKIDQEQLARVDLVSLSTTLATNACVENKGGKVKLILIACYPEIIERNSHTYGIPSDSSFEYVDAEITIDGVVNRAPDWDAFDEMIASSQANYDSFAVVSLWGMKNPELELTAKEHIHKYTDKPVVCGHELSTSLDVIKRACSALLNARLLPIIAEFIKAVTSILVQKNLNVPIFIVRSDGTIMTADFALDKPVETLLCGPAASVLGGMHLARLNDGMIIDMGGTTSDIALIRAGSPVLTPTGAVVGNFHTAVRSLLVNTIGLGGDTQVSINRYGEVVLGVRRVRPISDLVSEFPQVERMIYFTPTESRFLYILDDNYDVSLLTEMQRTLYLALKEERVMSATRLAAVVHETYLSNIAIGELEDLGVIMRSALTPTDVMMIRGDYDLWDKTAAEMILQYYAKSYETTVEAYCEEIYYKVKERMFCALAKMLFEQDEDKYFSEKEIDARLEQFFHNAYYKRTVPSDSILDYSIKCNIPIIGVGAPIHLFLPDVAKALGTQCVINSYSSVANAIGAAVCRISVTEDATIKMGRRYQVFTRMRSFTTSKYDEAIEIAKREAAKLAVEEAIKRGAKNPAVEVYVDEKRVGKKKEVILMETVVKATATSSMYSLIEN